ESGCVETGRRAVARPAIRFPALDHLGADRVEDNVPQYLGQVRFLLGQKRLESSAVKMPGALMYAVEPHHILGVQPVHPAREVGFRGLDEEVKVIRHQDERADAPSEAADGLSEEFEEHLAVVVVVEDGSPFIAAGGDVME